LAVSTDFVRMSALCFWVPPNVSKTAILTAENVRRRRSPHSFDLPKFSTNSSPHRRPLHRMAAFIFRRTNAQKHKLREVGLQIECTFHEGIPKHLQDMRLIIWSHRSELPSEPDHRSMAIHTNVRYFYWKISKAAVGCAKDHLVGGINTFDR
jgi:hypothetical protein